MRRLFLAVTMLALLAFFAGCSKPSEPSSTTDANGNTQQAAPANGATANNAAPANGTKAAPPAGMTPAGAAVPVATVVPAGTVVTVRLGETLGSKSSSSGQGFSATLAEPLTIGGRELAAKGAAASGTVVDAEPLGKFKGGAKLDLRLTSLTLNGQQVAVTTSIVDRQVKGKGKRSAVMIGGGAGLGALIGGLAGGGKGAAIGGLAGAGAGTGGTYFTGNKEIVLPAETALSFKLKEAVTVK